jgi:hypothetical protein
MIAYKPYSECPEELRPPGVLLDFPWQMYTCADTAAAEAAGFTVLADEDYAALVSSLATANATAMTTASIRVGILEPAQKFAAKIIAEFASENILMGITQAGMTGTVRAATTSTIAALVTGSLYDAMAEARAIPAENKDPVFVTDARLLQFINKIEAYLGLPASTEL